MKMPCRKNKVYLETFGCQMNVSDSERTATSLENSGYQITTHQEEANIIIFNTCSVREKAENKLFTRVGEIHAAKGKELPIIGVMGCVAQLEGETLFRRTGGIDFVIGTRAIGRMVEAIERVQGGQEFVADLGEREEVYDWSVNPEQMHSPYIGFVPIIEGCNKFCTYCIVPFSRGREKSRTASEIIRDVQNLQRRGIKEIHLIGQNVNSYRPVSDIGMEEAHGSTPFSRLLRAVARTGLERIKFTTSFPRDFHEDIVAALDEYENLCNWVHLPVQSGSDRILKAMRRGHTVESYLKRVAAIKSSKREISLTTDIIVGFPGETEQDFRDTVELVKKCQYDSAYIFKYSPRQGTPAAQMSDDVSGDEKTWRFLELEKVQKEIQRKALENCVGKTFQVLAQGRSSRYQNQLTGHTTCQKVVNFEAAADDLGKILPLKITQTKANSLIGVKPCGS
jgi:tRNA-2-methylthio-N6-dimethylallyladenosine synthase